MTETLLDLEEQIRKATERIDSLKEEIEQSRAACKKRPLPDGAVYRGKIYVARKEIKKAATELRELYSKYIQQRRSLEKLPPPTRMTAEFKEFLMKREAEMNDEP